MVFDPTGQLLTKCIKLNDLLPYLAEKMGIPNEFFWTADEIAQNEQQQALAMQQQQEQAMTDNVAMSNAIEQGKEDAKRNV